MIVIKYVCNVCGASATSNSLPAGWARVRVSEENILEETGHYCPECKPTVEEDAR